MSLPSIQKCYTFLPLSLEYFRIQLQQIVFQTSAFLISWTSFPDSTHSVPAQHDVYHDQMRHFFGFNQLCLTWRDLYGILVSLGSGLLGLSHKGSRFAHAGNLAKTIMLTKGESHVCRGKRKQVLKNLCFVGSKFRVLDAPPPPPPPPPHTMKNISSENMPTPSIPERNRVRRIGMM